jgi:predicted lipid-binding transport protein (Tim44 family)
MLDILFFACLAGFIIYRLYIVLGQSDDEDFERPKSHLKIVGGKQVEEEEKPKNIPLVIKNYKPVESREIIDIFEEIKAKDEEFEEINFIAGARKAFEIILKSLATGDKVNLNRLLSPEIYKNFTEEIATREKNNEDLETTLIGISFSEIIKAEIRNHDAFITIRFISEQTNVWKNLASGQIISGDPSQIETIEDIWTFTRNLNSTNPIWLLCATELS